MKPQTYDTRSSAPGHLRAVRHAAAIPMATVLLAGAFATPARAQLDPLLFAKRVPPTVVVVVDTSFRMLDDGHGRYYDPKIYTTAGDPVATVLGVTSPTYRRIYRALDFTNMGAGSKYEAATIDAVPSTSSAYASFFLPTRMEIARQGLARAVAENAGTPTEESKGWIPRWGLIRLRQSAPAWASECDRPVEIQSNAALTAVGDPVACASAGAGRFGVFAPTVSGPNHGNSSAPAGTVVADPSLAAQHTGSNVLALLAPSVELASQSTFIPAGRDSRDTDDRPLRYALTDALGRAQAAVAADSTAATLRNTVIVLITGGQDDGDGGYLAGGSITAKAAEFLTGGGTGRRMPIYVIGVVPDPADESELQEIATRSGGRYFEARTIADVTRAVNIAVQAGYGERTDFDRGVPTEFVPVSPIVGTVNLKDAKDAAGVDLPDTDILSTGGTKVPQRSNFMLTAGFALGGETAGGNGGPGFDGRLRAFRAFKPERDSTKPSGWKFIKDGTRLWPALDGRTDTPGLARTPASADSRNVFTYVPGSGTVAFSLANADLLAPHLGGADPTTLIPLVRGLPLGAVVGSTPALMDPPSLDPPPDEDYGRPNSDGTYAGDHADRRAIVFYGGNDGMIHAIDARTGFEVWAFIPYNLLPKLKTLADGQPVHQFEYFVDSSPKIAEVKMSGHWKSVLVIGQGPGGTFYQAFDVTEAGMDGPEPDSDDYSAVLSTFNSPERIKFLWAFPEYTEFNDSFDVSTAACPSANLTLLPDGTRTLPCRMTPTAADATPGGVVKLYGDLKVTATAVSKSVGFTWSDPAVGPLDSDRTKTVAIVGSGHFPAVETLMLGRKDDAPVIKPGQSFYLINMDTGRVLTNPSTCTGAGCRDVGDAADPSWRNALQADPTAVGDPGSYMVKKAYMGDLDGRYWRFTFNDAGTISATNVMPNGEPKLPIYNSSALLMVGTTEQYVFFGTGSDMLPRLSAIGGDNGPYRLYGVLDTGTSSAVKFAYALEWPHTEGSGKNQTTTTLFERPSTSPSVAGDIVFFTTTLEDDANLATLTSRLYAFTYLGGAAYDTNASGALTADDRPLVKDNVAGRATAPFIVDQHLYFATSAKGGANIEAFGNPEDYNNGVGQIGVRILSWREVR